MSEEKKTTNETEVKKDIKQENTETTPTAKPATTPSTNTERRDTRPRTDNRNSGPRNQSGRPSRPPRGKQRFFYTKKVCKFCTRQINEKDINYKNVDLLRRYTMPSGKIVPRRINGNCAKHQRMITAEIKKARNVAFLPFVDR